MNLTQSMSASAKNDRAVARTAVSPSHTHPARNTQALSTNRTGPKSGHCACGGGCPRCAASVAEPLGREGQGQPIEAGLRSEMEARFGTDFSRVRLHTGGRAALAARAIDARAYTSNQDIVFGDGAYDPQSKVGRALLAHELAHTLQAQRGPAGQLSDPDAASEREADAVAMDYLANRSLRPVRESGPALQRVPAGSRDVSTPTSQTISNAPAAHSAWNGTFSWTSRFGIEVSTEPDVVTIVMRLHTTASTAVQTAWENAIESKWGGRYLLSVTDNMGAVRCFALGVDVQWAADPADAHYTITPNTAGATAGGRAGLGGTTSMTGWGTADTVDVTHEFGHMLGNTDEYFTTNGVDFTQGGARRGFRDPGGGVMNNPSENPEPRHYEAVRTEVASLLGVQNADCKVIKRCLPRSAPGDYPLPSGETRLA